MQLSAPTITLFSIPKAFRGPADRAQRNAVNSWKQLGDNVTIVLVGDDEGVADAAGELGVQHQGNVATNRHGTPLVSSAFQLVHDSSDTPVLVYCNCDVILFEDFRVAIERLLQVAELEQFVAIGRRTDCAIDDLIDFQEPGAMATVERQLRQQGTPAPIVCKEYFAFTRGVYDQVPEFAVGRGNWDNWMVANAKQRGIPVVNISSQARVLHQQHDYSHSGQNRMECYVTGEEARENQRLAGGRNLVSGATSNWELGRHGVRKKRLAWLNGEFWLDSGRFLGLLANLIGSR